MPVRIWGASGGTGGKLILLATSPNITEINGAPDKIYIEWEQPDTEVPVESYNVYYSTTEPYKLSDMTLYGSYDENVKSCTLEGLKNFQKYYILVQAVGTNKYSNASIKNVILGMPEKYLLHTYEYNSGYIIMTSEDGKTWNTRVQSTSDGIYRSIAGIASDTLIATSGGWDGAISYSKDGGNNWVKNALHGNTTYYSYYDVVQLNDRFFSILRNSNGATTLRTSVDGIEWVDTNVNTDSIEVTGIIAYGNGRYLCIGKDYYVWYSTNGIEWIKGGYFTRAESICYGYGIFLIIPGNNTTAYFTADGINTVSSFNWTSTNAGTCCYGKGKFLVGNYYPDKFVYTVNQKDWIAVPKISTNSRAQNSSLVGFFNDLFIAYVYYYDTYGDICYSEDCITWTSVGIGRYFDAPVSHYGI